MKTKILLYQYTSTTLVRSRLFHIWVMTLFTTSIIYVVHMSWKWVLNPNWFSSQRYLAMNYNTQVVVLNCSCIVPVWEIKRLRGRARDRSRERKRTYFGSSTQANTWRLRSIYLSLSLSVSWSLFLPFGLNTRQLCPLLFAILNPIWYSHSNTYF